MRGSVGIRMTLLKVELTASNRYQSTEFHCGLGIVNNF